MFPSRGFQTFSCDDVDDDEEDDPNFYDFVDFFFWSKNKIKTWYNNCRKQYKQWQSAKTKVYDQFVLIFIDLFVLCLFQTFILL